MTANPVLRDQSFMLAAGAFLSGLDVTDSAAAPSIRQAFEGSPSVWPASLTPWQPFENKTPAWVNAQVVLFADTLHDAYAFSDTRGFDKAHALAACVFLSGLDEMTVTPAQITALCQDGPTDFWPPGVAAWEPLQDIPTEKLRRIIHELAEAITAVMDSAPVIKKPKPA